MSNSVKIVFSIIAFTLLFTNNLSAQGADFSSPEATLQTYLAACKEGNFEKSDRCYTKEYQRFIATDKNYQAHRNPGQLRNEYNYLHDKKYKLEMYGNKAIMRFSPPFTRPEPLYFMRENGVWKIDGMFSYNNVIIEGAGSWHWADPNIDSEKEWLRGK